MTSVELFPGAWVQALPDGSVRVSLPHALSFVVQTPSDLFVAAGRLAEAITTNLEEELAGVEEEAYHRGRRDRAAELLEEDE